ncbi:NAD(P)-dependent oxidoreductase [Corticibacterium sp. UT-5YL-CI-8]|nr:NAD(P)-dependent oxidoreductase [Tianweitania sp. UT-5YL-CI-8]
MRIVVTGGSGRVGKFIVADLAAHGHEVTSIDFSPAPTRLAGVRFMTGDVSKFEDIAGALSYAKADAIVHMAAWSDPGIVADTKTYGDNARATFNVLQAAHDLRLNRVIVASSAQVYGFAEKPPLYAPVDEEHPLTPLNSYALSKIAGEEAARYFTDRHGLNVLTFRIMGVRAPQDIAAEIARSKVDPAPDRFLLWTRTDARDIATGCRLALEAESVASGIYNLSGSCNILEKPSAELLALHSAGTEIRSGLEGDSSPFSSAKARKAFGYEPKFVWSVSRDHAL